MQRNRFEQLVEEAVRELPPFFQEKMENLAIVVEDDPPPDIQAKFPGQMLLGLYQGVPMPNRSVWAEHMYPDMISIYQRNIEQICRTDSEVVAQVKKTVMHEIGHYFGFDEDELADMGLA